MKFVAQYFDPVLDSDGKEIAIDLEVSVWTGDGQFVSKTIERILPLPNGEYNEGLILSAIARAKARLVDDRSSKDFGEILRRLRDRRDGQTA